MCARAINALQRMQHARRQRVIDVLRSCVGQERDIEIESQSGWEQMRTCTWYIHIYIDIRALRIFVHNDTIYTCTDAASCQGVRVERAQRVQDNLMGNNHDTHRIAHTPPWPRSDCRNAGLYFLRMRTINHQLRTVLTHPTLPFSRIFLTLSFSFALFLLLFDTANWKRLGTETFGNLALSVTSMMSTKFTKNLLELISKQTYTWC